MGGPVGHPAGGYPGAPTGGQQPLQGRIVQPGTAVPDAVEAEPVFPADAGAATQNMNAVVDDGATQAIPPVTDDFGGRQMYRDAPRRSGGDPSTAEIDLSGLDDYDEPPSRRRGGGNGKKVLIAVGFVALLAVGGGGAFLVATGGGGSTDAGLTAEGAPDAPVTLETGGLFPEEVEVGGAPFTLAITDDTGDCDTAAHGDYGQALVDAQCQQIVRATYVNGDGTRAVTVGVAAMAGPEDAATAQDAQDLASGQWFAGLAGQDGSGAERMGYAAGHGTGGQWGPYLVFALAANADGRPAEGQADELADLGDGFVDAVLEPLGEQAG
jgi:hypothetical protein